MKVFPEILLTVAIPTFGRPGEVADRLKELTAQMDPHMEIVIFENGATAETRDAILPYLSDRVRYEPSSVNRGFTLNVLRCFEETRSEWVWILGDDDQVLSGSISKLMNWLGSCEDNFFITTRPFRAPDYSSRSILNLDELFDSTTFSEALFLSSTIWRRRDAIKLASVFSDAGFSMGPQIAMMLRMVEGRQGIATVHFDTLIHPKSDEHRWSRLQYMKRILSLFDMMETDHGAKSLAKASLNSWIWASISSLKEVHGITKWKAWFQAFLSGWLEFRRHTGGTTFLFSFIRTLWGSMWRHRSKIKSPK